jgi:capsular polysaccharide biosynthesis protein
MALTKKESEKETIKKIVKKISFHVKSDSAIIYRNNTDLPFIVDKIENSIKWLIDNGYKQDVDNGYKQDDIEIIGEKPSTWDSMFSPTI